MKKILFTISAAALVLAGCAKIETVKVDENRAIGFSNFVNNPTKAVTPVTDLTNFYVFGNYGDGSNWNGQAFNNEINTAVYYWQPNMTYRFGAYANGNNGKIDNAQYDAQTKTLTFNEYTPDDTKDLIVSVTDNIIADNYIDGTSVGLNFIHMLSQIKLTFTTDAAATYQLTVSNVQINGAVSKAKGTYNGTASWTGEENTGYTYEEFNDGKVISSGVPAEQVKFVIPQTSTDALSVTFTAEIKGETPSGSKVLSKNFTATLGHSISDHNANTWQNGYCYNYTANISIKDIVDNPQYLVQITFDPTVSKWDETDTTETQPTPEP